MAILASLGIDLEAVIRSGDCAPAGDESGVEYAPAVFTDFSEYPRTSCRFLGLICVSSSSSPIA